MGLKITKTGTEPRRRASRLFAEYSASLMRLRLMWHEGGQDLIEYTLMAATIAVAVSAIFPQTLAPNISAVFSKVQSSLVAARL